MIKKESSLSCKTNVVVLNRYSVNILCFQGLESSCTIPNGQPVIEVIGKVMTKQQYDKDNFGQRQYVQSFLPIV